MNWGIVEGRIESIDEAVPVADVVWHVIEQAGKGNPQALLDLCEVFATDELVQDLLVENLAIHTDAAGEQERMERECRP